MEKLKSEELIKAFKEVIRQGERTLKIVKAFDKNSKNDIDLLNFQSDIKLIKTLLPKENEN